MDRVTDDGYRMEEVKCKPVKVDINSSDHRRVAILFHCAFGSETWERAAKWYLSGKKLWVQEEETD